MDPPATPTGPFDDCVNFQEASTELVVYSPTVRQIVTVAWPLFQNNRIVPKGIKAWLRNRGLHWSCFCPLVSGRSLSTRIVESLEGDVLVFCNAYPSKCGFFLNLTSIHHSAALEAEYDLPTLASGRKPPMRELSMAFILNAVGDAELGPYFEGYCGEHISEHVNIEQLSGGEIALDLVLNCHKKTPRQFATINQSKNRYQARRVSRPSPSLAYRGHPYERVKKQAPFRSVALPPLLNDSPFPFPFSFPVSMLPSSSLPLPDPGHASTSCSSISHASTSHTSISALPQLTLSAFADRPTAPAPSVSELAPDDHDEGSPNWSAEAQKVFDRLSAGQGVCMLEWDELVETCTACMQLFTPGGLRKHIPKCDGSIAL